MCIFVDKLLIMKDFVFYIKLEHYLAQWLTHSLGNPVRFPAQSNENSVIRRFLQKLPPDKLPEMPSDDTVAIVIPRRKIRRCTITWVRWPKRRWLNPSKICSGAIFGLNWGI